MPRAWCLLALAFCIGSARGAGPAISFELPDHHGKAHRLADLADRPLVVVAFLGTECPLAKLYAVRLNDLSKEFGPRGVAFLAVDANVQDSLAEMGQFARSHQLAFPFLKDRDGAVAAACQVTRTPEVVLLDRARRVIYQGRVDDQYGFGLTAGYAKPTVKERYLATAINEALAGRPVHCPKTEPVGCLIGKAPAPGATGAVNYSKHVAPILQDHCVQCHRSGEVAPFALDTYAEAAGWASMMLEVVDQGRMPPWFADPAHGKFHNDPRLSEDEKRTLRDWVASGCPEGNPADLPPAKQFATGWLIPKPDLVVPMSKRPFKVPAEGVVPYQWFSVDPGFTEDKWIKASEARPGNRAVVHHIIVFAVPPGQNSEFGGGGTARLGVAGYAPGEQPRIYPDGVALRVPKGYRLLFQMHYTPSGTETDDMSSVGFVFADPKEVKKQAKGGAAFNVRFAIPAGADNHELTAQYTFLKDTMLTFLFPHMHLRGKSFRFEALYPDGKREILLNVPRYDFNWQLRYDLAEPKRIPKGTRLLCTATFDNSDGNPANPDPSKTVRWGPQTWDEMMIGFFGTIPTDDDPHPLGPPPRAKVGRARAALERGGE